MPSLYNISIETVCDINKKFLTEHPDNLINAEGFIDLSSISGERKDKIIDQIIENEKSNKESNEKNYQKLKYNTKNIIEFLVLSLAMSVAILTLVPIFIVSSIVLPILPVLFFGVAIIAITKLVLNMKINQLESKVVDADKALNQLLKSNGVDLDNEEISNDLSKQIQKIEKATKAINNKIDSLPAMTSHSLSELLTNRGTFSKYEDPANILRNENIPSYSHS